MHSHSHIKVERGKVWHGPSGASVAVDSADYGDSVFAEGLPANFANLNPSTKLERDKTRVICVLLRNVTGSTLSGGDAVSFASGYAYKRAGSKVYAIPTATVFGNIDAIVDDWYGSAQVKNGQLFWAVIKGQVLAYTSVLANAENVMPVGAYLVASSAAGSTAAGAGKLGAVDFTGATAILANTILAGRKIRAMSAKTTSNTNVQVLVEVDLGNAA